MQEFRSFRDLEYAGLKNAATFFAVELQNYFAD